MKRRRQFGILSALWLVHPAVAAGAGTLAPLGSPDRPMQIEEHHVEVTLNNGFAKTEVVQTFVNPNSGPREGLYSFPLPKRAALSEMTITSGETTIQGEVLARPQAEKLYAEESSRGNQSGLATKESYQRFEFRVAPLIPGQQTTVRFVYYQPLEIDTGVGRYLYPLEEGGTDEMAASFWQRNDQVEGSFSLRLTLKSAWPIEELRVPGFEAAAKLAQPEPDLHTVELVQPAARLNRDFLLYYRLAEDLPGRVELIAHRSRADAPGTFMMVVTPGADLKPLDHGADYVFVLDRSGSMADKLATLAGGVQKALGNLSPRDRFRVVTFASSADELTSGWQTATPEHVQNAAAQVAALDADGSTDLYDGLKRALKDLDEDRATSVLLVTDGVTNTGVIDPRAFAKLLQQYDVRLFGFLMGNSANWPLMQLVAETTGGFYATVSNSDDILGQLMLAKSKIRFEAMHDVELKLSGVTVTDLTDVPKKLYRGQQLVIFGRYQTSGAARIALATRLTGEDKTYGTRFTFPEIETDNPELERLWAMARVDKLAYLADTGQLDRQEADAGIRDLGLAYQLVTDETAMVVLSDEAFTRHKVERHNRARVTLEAQAQSQRQTRPTRNYRIDDAEPMFKGRAPRLGRGGGGALAPRDVLWLGAFAVIGLLAWRRSRVRE